MKPHLPVSFRKLNRRRFLRAGAAAIAAGAGGLAWVGSPRVARAAAAKSGNPFAYDVSRHAKTDPRWLHYAEVKRFRCPHETARRLSFGPDGRLYVAAGKYVCIFDSEGRSLGEKALTGEARAVAAAADGTLYVSLRDHVEVFAPKADRPTAWDSPGKRAWITGLAVTDNDLFAADAGGRVIWRHDRSGKVVGRIGERDPARNVPGLILPSPYLDVDVHPDGLLRVNNPGRHHVEAYTFDGHLELAWGKPTMAIEGFSGCCNPIAVAMLPDGRIVTCEKGLPRVKVYSVHGEFESVVAGPESFAENLKAGSGDDPADGSHAALDAAVDGKGRVYVLDTVTRHIHVLEKKSAV